MRADVDARPAIGFGPAAHAASAMSIDASRNRPGCRAAAVASRCRSVPAQAVARAGAAPPVQASASSSVSRPARMSSGMGRLRLAARSKHTVVQRARAVGAPVAALLMRER